MKEDEARVQSRMRTTARRAKRKADRMAAAAAKREMDLKKYSPAIVGFLRGLVSSIIVGLIGGLTAVVQSGSMGKGGLILVGTTVATAVLRFIEGILDGKAGAKPSPTPLGFAKKTK